MNTDTIISTLILVCIIVGWIKFSKKVDLIEEHISLNHGSGMKKYEEDLDSIFDFSKVKTSTLTRDEEQVSKNTSEVT